MDNPQNFKTFGENSWGMTACDSPEGYRGDFGALLYGSNNILDRNDGTIAPCGAAGSIVFTPEESIDAMNHYKSYKNLWGKYGFKDAYNLDARTEWFSDIEIGIDKGISLLMIENYRSGLIWSTVMKNKYVKKGLEILEIKSVNTKVEETA